MFIEICLKPLINRANGSFVKLVVENTEFIVNYDNLAPKTTFIDRIII